MEDGAVQIYYGEGHGKTNVSEVQYVLPARVKRLS